MHSFSTFLKNYDIEQDYEYVIQYVIENADYETEEELDELLRSLTEDDIEYILDEGFGSADLSGYKPSGNQRGASEPTPAPKTTVRRGGKPAKKVATQSSGDGERKPGQAPRGDKPSIQKPEQPPAKESERPAASKPKQRRLQKTSDPSTMPKEEPKKQTPTASNSDDKPKRKAFRANVKKTGVISSGKKTSEREKPEAKERAKHVKRYLKKGTSAKKVQQYVTREKKRQDKEAKAKEAETKKQERAQRPPKPPKAQTSGSEAQPKKEVAPRKPKPPKAEKPSPEAAKRHQEPEERGSEGDKAAAERRKKLQTKINDRLLNANVLKKKRGKFSSTSKKSGTVSAKGKSQASYGPGSSESRTKAKVKPTGITSKPETSKQTESDKKPEQATPKTTQKRSKVKLSGLRKRGYVKGARSDYEVRKPEQRSKFKSTAKKSGTVSGGGVKTGVGDAKEVSSKKEVKSYISKTRRGGFKSSQSPKGTVSAKGAQKRKAGDSVEASSKEKVKSYVASKKPKKSLKDFIKGGISKAKSKLKKTARGALLKLARKMKEDYETCEFLALMLIQEGYAQTIEEAAFIIEEAGIESFQEILSE